MTHDEVTVAAAGGARWEDVSAVMGTRGDPASCWCQWFKLRRSEWDAASRQEKSALLHEQLDETDRGVLAYVGGAPVGWAAVEPFSAYPALTRSPITRRRDGDPADPWAATCFVVRLEFRGRGIARALLAGAIGHARDHGAEVLEGYPVDPQVRPSLSSAERYHGTVGLFRAAGFEEVRRPSATRAIMRLRLR
ncbi:GNAT family N-acetyltransferase [Leifsonia sp. AG29]|uniref:GNAT family N-acetyltransferase n=1 Tax=Leifsonia sp. AG29 TaxID=2598860 RepID=UPI0022796695|nr:GNAT family N-acetyltransferase [Leifsonia sp. AG29]